MVMERYSNLGLFACKTYSTCYSQVWKGIGWVVKAAAILRQFQQPSVTWENQLERKGAKVKSRRNQYRHQHQQQQQHGGGQQRPQGGAQGVPQVREQRFYGRKPSLAVLYEWIGYKKLICEIQIKSFFHFLKDFKANSNESIIIGKKIWVCFFVMLVSYR